MTPDLTLDLQGVPLHLRLIPAGEFMMGSRGYESPEEPRHRVIIPAPFYLGVYPVTQAQFAVWKRDHENHFAGKPNHPAENMDWHEAVAFCDWLHQQSLVPAGYRACLPNEAQWEYACRAGTNTEYANGDGEAALHEMGWFGEDWATGSTHPVGELKPNAWGLYDMHGNVFEWCADAWDESAYAQREDGWTATTWPTADEDPARVFRGGSFGYAAWWCRAAFRGGWLPSDRVRLQGFRLCLAPGPVVGGAPENKPERSGRLESEERGTSPETEGVDGAGLFSLRVPKRTA